MKYIISALAVIIVCVLAGILGFLIGALGLWFSVTVVVILFYLNVRDYKVKKQEKRNETYKKD